MNRFPYRYIRRYVHHPYASILAQGRTRCERKNCQGLQSPTGATPVRRIGGVEGVGSRGSKGGGPEASKRTLYQPYNLTNLDKPCSPYWFHVKSTSIAATII